MKIFTKFSKKNFKLINRNYKLQRKKKMKLKIAKIFKEKEKLLATTNK
jgi:hypothetical protein